MTIRERLRAALRQAVLTAGVFGVVYPLMFVAGAVLVVGARERRNRRR